MKLPSFLSVSSPPLSPFRCGRTYTCTRNRPCTFYIRQSRRSPISRTLPRMVVTPSTMLPLGTKAPDFALLEPLTGKKLSLAEVKGENGLLVVFICNHCPFVIHIQDELAALGRDFKLKGVGMVGISSNDVRKYPSDAPDEMAKMASGKFNTFPYLFDETQEVAKAYRAACTPDIFLFDKDMTLSYRGQIDDSRPGNRKPITGRTIREATELMVEGKQYPEASMMPSMGCNIKWIKGNEPDYFG